MPREAKISGNNKGPRWTEGLPVLLNLLLHLEVDHDEGEQGEGFDEGEAERGAFLSFDMSLMYRGTLVTW